MKALEIYFGILVRSVYFWINLLIVFVLGIIFPVSPIIVVPVLVFCNWFRGYVLRIGKPHTISEATAGYIWGLLLYFAWMVIK